MNWAVKLWNQIVFINFDPLNMVILNISASQKICSSNGLEDTAMLGVTLPMKMSVIIFGVFEVDKNFGTHPKLFLRS